MNDNSPTSEDTNNHVHHRHIGFDGGAGENNGIEMTEPSSSTMALSNGDDSEEIKALVRPGEEYNDDDVEESAAVDSHGFAAGTASNAQVAVNIIISFVGAGLLGVPNAFRQSGWLLGSITLCCVSMLNVYAMLLLPTVKRKLDKNGSKCDSYGELGLLILGPRGEDFVNLCLVISQVGFATAYIIFIAANLYNIAQIPRWIVCSGCIPGLCCLVQAREMKTLSPFSLLADFANLLGLSAVLFEDWETYTPHDDTIHSIKWEGFLYVIAITIYSMEGVGLILSLESSCRDRSHFPGLFKTVLASITLFMAMFGSAGYLGFGDGTQAPITLNLTESGPATFVKSALCLALYLTYPVMMFPVWEISERVLTSTHGNSLYRVAFRSTLVGLTALVAYCVPDFGEFLGLVGSSICTILGFILPCYFHFTVMREELVWWEIGIDIFLMLGGTLFGIFGTWNSLVKLLD